MSGSRYVHPDQFYVDATGVPLAGGRLFFYATGTTTPQTTYYDAGFTTPNPNPVILDPAGRSGSIFLLPSPNYRVVLQDINGVTIFDFDPVGEGAGGQSAGAAAVPVGGIIAYAGASAPAGFLFCDGSVVSRTTYSVLFGVIQTAFGAGDGATTFQIPDLRGRAPFGKDDMGTTGAANRITIGTGITGSNIAGTQLGATGGNENLQQHTHAISTDKTGITLNDPGHQHNTNITAFSAAGGGHGFIGPGGGGAGQETFLSEVATTNDTLTDPGHTHTISNFGQGTSGSNNIPPMQICNWIIYHG